MANDDELLKQFYAVFGNKGGDVYPGNVGISRTAQAVCHEMMNLPDPVLYDHFLAGTTAVKMNVDHLGLSFGSYKTVSGKLPGHWPNCIMISFSSRRTGQRTVDKGILSATLVLWPGRSVHRH